MILNFNAASVSPNTARDVLPPGWYNVTITASVEKPTKAADGSYLELEMTILDGPQKGRKLWDRLNLQNRNEKAVEIAYGTLSAICHAVGVIQLTDSHQLHGIPLQARVKVRPAEGSYSEANEVSGYKQAEGLVAPTGTAPSWVATPPPAQQAKQPAAVPPWAKGA